MRGAKRARFIAPIEFFTTMSGTSEGGVGDVTSSMRPSRSTLKCISTLLSTASDGSTCERSMELIDGCRARMRGDSSILVLFTCARAFQASA
jgi:hypothetical protein